MVDVFITLNARLMPLDRGERFGDPLVEILAGKFREVEETGGGTLLSAQREPQSSDVDLAVKGNAAEVLSAVLVALERLGAPKGSAVRVTGGAGPLRWLSRDRIAKVGVTEGIGIYLNGTDLPDEVYQTSDVNELIAQLNRALGDAGQRYSAWEGPTETALYYYGPSAARMRELVTSVLASHPLAQRCRVVQLTP
jgi:hypothetical protein